MWDRKQQEKHTTSTTKLLQKALHDYTDTSSHVETFGNMPLVDMQPQHQCSKAETYLALANTEHSICTIGEMGTYWNKDHNGVTAPVNDRGQ